MLLTRMTIVILLVLESSSVLGVGKNSAKVLYRQVIAWKDQQIVVRVVDVKLQPWVLEVYKAPNLNENRAFEELLVFSTGKSTAALTVLHDSTLLVQLKMCETCSPYPQVTIPLWKNITPLYFNHGALEEEDTVVGPAHIVSDSLIRVTVERFDADSCRFEVEVYPISGLASWDSFYVLGAEDVSCRITGPYSIDLTIQWDAVGTVETLKVTVPIVDEEHKNWRHCVISEGKSL